MYLIVDMKSHKSNIVSHLTSDNEKVLNVLNYYLKLYCYLYLGIII